MLELITVLIALVVLFVAGVILYKGREVKVAETKKEVTFETEYDELTHLYTKGELSEQAYKEKIKNIIN